MIITKILFINKKVYNKLFSSKYLSKNVMHCVVFSKVIPIIKQQYFTSQGCNKIFHLLQKSVMTMIKEIFLSTNLVQSEKAAKLRTI